MPKEKSLTSQNDIKFIKEEVLNDYRIANESRQASLLGRREVLTGKAKFGIFGDGKEIEYEENKRQENAKKTIKTIPLCVFEEIEYSDNETENAQNREIAKNSVDFKKVEESDINI